MKTQRWQCRMWSVGLTVLAAASSLIAATASAQVIRTFDSVPENDSLINSDATVDPDGTGTGGKLGTVTPLGGGNSSFNNTAATGFGMDAPAYGGAYRIWGANLAAGLGTTSLTNFTLAYAYKPDSPNHPTDNKSSRQIRMWNTSNGLTSLTVSITGRRPVVRVNYFDPNDPLLLQHEADFGNPSGASTQRLMDGDTTTIPASGGTYNPANPTEWVFFAMTYEALTPTSVRVTEYGQIASTSLTQIHQSTLDVTASSTGSTLDITGQALDIGNALFGGPLYRPYDAHFDNFGLYASTLSLEQLTALGNAVFTEPAFDPGDFNEDGAVDILDYVVWRSNPSAHGGDNGYTDWAANYDPASPGSGSSAVPEPAAAIGILIGTAFLAGYRRRRWSL